MKTSKQMILSLSFGVAAAVAAIGAQAADSPSMAPQQVTVSARASTEPQAKWISIGRGDTVKFTQNGQSYTLRLDQNTAAAGASETSLQDVHVSVTPDAVASN
jgi:hypothetical protein